MLTVAANPTHKFCSRSKARTIIVPWAVMSWWWCVWSCVSCNSPREGTISMKFYDTIDECTENCVEPHNWCRQTKRGHNEQHRVWTEKPNQETLKVMLTSEPKSRGLSWRMPVETTSPWPTVSAPSTTMVSSMARDAVQQWIIHLTKWTSILDKPK